MTHAWSDTVTAGCASDKRTGKSSVDVVIVHWNTPRLLERCLVSLWRQTLPPDNILVVDNGSDCPAEPRPDHVGVRRILLPKNIGFAAASNLGVRSLAKNKWIALVNPDVELAPDWLEQLCHAAARHPEYSFFASCLLQYHQPKLLDGAGDSYHVSGLAWRRGYGQPLDTRTGVGSREVFSACAAAALYRRSAWDEASGLDENYFCYFEDVDLGFRLRLLGHRCLYVPSATARHIGSASTSHDQQIAAYYGHRNLVWTYWKNMPMLLWCTYLPQHLLANLLVLVWSFRRRRVKTMIKAKWDAICGLRHVWRQRTKIQKTRRISCRELRAAMCGVDELCGRYLW